MSTRVANHNSFVIDQSTLRTLMSSTHQVLALAHRSTFATLMTHFANVDGVSVGVRATGASPLSYGATTTSVDVISNVHFRVF